jgi:hypothetical protein
MSSAERVAAQNYEQFRDCLAAVLLERMSEPSRTSSSKAQRRKERPARKRQAPEAGTEGTQPPVNFGKDEDAMEELAEFIDYIAGEVFDSLPPELRALDYVSWADNPQLAARLALPLTTDTVIGLLHSLDPSLEDSLHAYRIIDNAHPDFPALTDLLAPVLNTYLTAATTPLPASRPTRKDVGSCEICGREWITLTYHHLIPREVHDKVVKRGWHRKDQLNNVAWLCRPCHSFVHDFASNEDLARHYYTTELLLDQDEVVAFAKWAAKLRWKGGQTVYRG